jgi:hypothetical protein
LKIIATALDRALKELNGREGDLLYLGACRGEHRFPLVDGCTSLEHARPVTTAHAIAYRQSVYPRILEEVPPEHRAMEEWLRTYMGIDQYYAFRISEKIPAAAGHRNSAQHHSAGDWRSPAAPRVLSMTLLSFASFRSQTVAAR